MRVLLDTHILLWALAEPRKLPKEARALIEDPAAEILFSAASIWEIAIKSQIGRISLKIPPSKIAEAAADSGFLELPVRSSAAGLVAELPLHHRDPFDRLLMTQALSEPAVFCTADKGLASYSNLVKFSFFAPPL